MYIDTDVLVEYTASIFRDERPWSKFTLKVLEYLRFDTHTQACCNEEPGKGTRHRAPICLGKDYGKLEESGFKSSHTTSASIF